MPSNIEPKERRKRQTRLAFERLTDEASSPPAKGVSPAKVQCQLPGKKQTSLSSFQSSPPVEDGDSDSEDILSSTVKRSAKPTSRKKSGGYTAFPTPAKSSQPYKGSLPDNSDKDDEEPTLPSVRKTLFTPQKRPGVKIPGSQRKNIIELDSDSDEEPITSPLSRRRGGAALDESDSDIISSPVKRRRTTRVVEAEEEEEEVDLDSDGSLPSPGKITSRSKQKGKGKGKGHQEERSESSATPRHTRQTKTRKHRTEKEKTLELMKRKRAGEKISQLTDSESDSELEVRGIYDTDDELQVLSEFDDEEESPEETKSKRGKGKSKATSYRGEKNEDDYDSDFVDDDGPIGVPGVGLLDIPLEFTHAAHKPLKEHFKDAVEWMVHNKINPAFKRDDPIYKQAFLKLNGEALGLATSKFVSTQWTHAFTRAIYARPGFLERPREGDEGFDFDGVPKCDTCNHRKHYPSFAIQFKGKAYDKNTLEELEDNDSDNDDASVDENGQDLPDESKEWFSGRTCRDNAQQAHTLIHWKWHLNSWVIDMLESSGQLKAAKLTAREKMKPKQRREDANNVVDSWEAQGLVKGLYRDFKIILDTARNASTGGRWGK